MIPVSNDYKQAIKSQTREFDFIAKIDTFKGSIRSFGSPGISIESQDDSEISEDESTLDGLPFVYNYASLEQNYTKLDGSFILPNRSDNINTGFIGSKNTSTVSLGGLALVSPVKNTPVNIDIYFNNGYPTSYRIEIHCTYKLSGTSYNKTVVFEDSNNTKDVISVKPPETLVESGSTYTYNNMGSCDIIINSWNNSNHRVRIKKIFFGDTVLIDNDDLISFDLLEQTDLSGISIPSNQFNIKLNNYDKKYNILDPNNILNKLNDSTYIASYIGLNVNGSYEYVYLGGYKYTSYRENSDKTIEFDFDGRLKELTKLSALEDTDFENDVARQLAFYRSFQTSDMSDITYTGTYPIQYIKDDDLEKKALSVMLYYNASTRENRGKINQSTEDYKGAYDLVNEIKLFNIDNTVKDTITLENQTKNPIFTKYMKTKRTNYTYTSFTTLNNDKTEVYKDVLKQYNQVAGNWVGFIDITLTKPISASTIDVYWNNNKIMNNSSPISGYNVSATITESNYYHLEIMFDLTNESDATKEFRIDLKEYETTPNLTTIENTSIEKGAILDIESETIRNNTDRTRVNNYILNNEKDFEFETEILGDPSFEVGDTIMLESPNGYHTATISSIDTKYDGGLIQTIKGVSTGVLQ